jgi:hypothetical protein
MPLGIFRLEPRLAAGVVLAGNLGGALLQEGSHTVLGVARPFPQSYDSLSAVAPAAALSARALWESGSLKAALAGELAGDPLEGLGAKAGITAGIGSGQGSLSVTLAARMDWATGASPTLARVSASESGVTLRVDCVAGYLRGSRQLNVSTGVSNGAVGVQLGGASADRGSALPLALEAAFMATFRGTGQRVLAPVLGRGVRFYASQGGGWWTAVGTDGAGIRYSDYGCGLEGRLLTAMGNLELEAGCALGAHAVFLTAQPLGEARSSILSTTAGAGLRIEPVLRAGILEGGGGERMRKTGLGAGCGFDALLWNIPAPPRQEPFVEVFFFGEAR